MKTIFKLSAILMVVFSLSSCSERIDAGHTGILVNLYGSERGVDDVTAVTGRQWYNPFTEEVHEVPTFVQNSEYVFTITSKDGLPIKLNVGLNYRVKPESVVSIFKQYRKPLHQLEDGILAKRTRECFSRSMSRFTAEESYARKIDVLTEANQLLTKDLDSRGFYVEGLVYMNDPQPPKSVIQNIEAKVNQQQEALKEKAKVQQAIFEAEKNIAKARGDSASLMINAHAEAEAMKVKQRQLTPLLIKHEFIQSWDGKLPTYGEVPQLFKSISGK